MEGSELRDQLREIRCLWWDVRWAIHVALEVHRKILRDVVRGMRS
jgi:hypothetical protein